MDVTTVVRDPNGGLLGPMWFLALCALALIAMLFRRTWTSIAFAICVIATVWYRERLMYVFVRNTIEYSDKHGHLDEQFLQGLRTMHDYVAATELYSVGCTALLAGVLLISPWLARRARGETTGAPREWTQ